MGKMPRESRVVCGDHEAKAKSASLPQTALADSPRKSPPQLLPVPLAPRPFLLPGGLTAQEGIKGPEEGAQARDSRHQDGPQDSAGPVRPCPHHAWAHEVRGRPLWRWDGSSLFSPGALDLQPEAMLLWLTLALLWSPTCWVHHKFSWGSPRLSPWRHPSPSLCPGLGSGPALRQTDSALRPVPSSGEAVSSSLGQK